MKRNNVLSIILTTIMANAIGFVSLTLIDYSIEWVALWLAFAVAELVAAYSFRSYIFKKRELSNYAKLMICIGNFPYVALTFLMSPWFIIAVIINLYATIATILLDMEARKNESKSSR